MYTHQNSVYVHQVFGPSRGGWEHIQYFDPHLQLIQYLFRYTGTRLARERQRARRPTPIGQRPRDAGGAPPLSPPENFDSLSTIPHDSIIDMGLISCSACGKRLPSGWFSKNGSDRRRSQCRDCMRVKRSADRAKRRSAVVERTPVTLLGRLYRKQEGLCGICHRPVGVLRRYWHLDHVVPIARGGRHEERNLQITHPLCNLRKGSSRVVCVRGI
jgi:5-methylcytosine-specific restriction endonuclease McrA